MSTINRIKRILRATVGDLVESAKDPELELARFVEKAELSLGEVRAEIEKARVRRDRCVIHLAEHRRQAEQWTMKAEEAAARAEDERAKEALFQHRFAREEVEAWEDQLAEARRTLASLEKDEVELKSKLREAQLEQRRLSARLRRAEAERMSSAVLIDSDRPAPGPQRVRDAIVATEAESEAAREVHEESPDIQFAALERRASLDEELSELKGRLKKGKGRDTS